MNHYKLIPVSRLANCDGMDIVQIYKDRWWIVDKEDNLLFYRGYSPQCNSNKSIAKSIRDKLYPDLDVRQIETIYIPIKCDDFEYDLKNFD